MASFLSNAEELFTTAKLAGREVCDYSLLVHRGGGIHVIADSDWAPEALLAHHGAEAVYRVRRGTSGVLVDARCGRESCRLRSEDPAPSWQAAPDFPRYTIAAEPRALLPACRPGR